VKRSAYRGHDCAATLQRGSVALSRDGRRRAVASHDARFSFGDLRAESQSPLLLPCSEGLRTVASMGRLYVVSRSTRGDGCPNSGNVKGGSPIGVFFFPDFEAAGVMNIAFSQEGLTGWADRDGAVQLWTWLPFLQIEILRGGLQPPPENASNLVLTTVVCVGGADRMLPAVGRTEAVDDR